MIRTPESDNPTLEAVSLLGSALGLVPLQLSRGCGRACSLDAHQGGRHGPALHLPTPLTTSRPHSG